METEFDFFTHFPVMLKSAGKDKISEDRVIYMNSSNEKLDLQGDVVDSSGIRKSLNFYLKCGKIDYDHKSLVDPRFLIGEPISGEITDDGILLVKGRLYKGKGMAIADSVWDLLKAKASLGVSIGGKILETEDFFHSTYQRTVNRVKKVLLNHLAITPYPINVWTDVKTVPWGSFLKSLTTASPGGAAMMTESLEGGGNRELRRKRKDKDLKVIFKDFMKLVQDADHKEFICPHIAPDGSFVNGEHGAKRHFIECVNLDEDKAEFLVDYIFDNHDQINDIVEKKVII